MNKELKEKIKSAGPCYVAEDGQIFPDTYEGQRRAFNHVRGGKVRRFDSKGKEIDIANEKAYKARLVKHIEKDPGNKYGKAQLVNMHPRDLERIYRILLAEGKINELSGDASVEESDPDDLNAMTKKGLEALLIELDPSFSKTEAKQLSKEKILPVIVAAQSLAPNVYKDNERLAKTVSALNETGEAEAGALARNFKNGELRELVFYLRGDVEIDDELLDRFNNLEIE